MTKSELLAVAKPILFNTEMVKATLEGRKTATRRNFPRYIVEDENGSFTLLEEDDGYSENWTIESLMANGYLKPKYKVGDILYVRETWQKKTMLGSAYFYRADEETNSIFEKVLGKWHHSVHMPKEAARIFLKVTDVRVERLQDIKVSEAHKEGVIVYFPKDYVHYNDFCYIEFEKLWNSTIKKSDLNKYGWNANPYVWVYEFERIEAEQ